MPLFDDHFISAHRGASGAFPENTLLAFAEAARAGVRSIETDLSLLADDSFAVFHDATLGRTVTGYAPIGSFDRAGLANLDAGVWRDAAFAGVPVPALADLLSWQKETGIGLNLEIKCHHQDYRRHAAALTRALAQVDPEMTLISSFDAGCLAAVMPELPQIARALIAEELPDDWRDIADRLQLDGFHLNHENLTVEQVGAIHAAGLAVRCYTVNEAADIEKLRGYGVDLVMTDWPGKFIKFDHRPGQAGS
ncbi:MAG: glycerophosphodiester phosphodiesterase family protein [Candidatus Puniceispirillaceae bacterium]|jgi:glycerophosphoryl diester phosphodiesterase